ncbi:MAG: RQC domain-containing protein, partial [Gammaproteobacteria bacterium]
KLLSAVYRTGQRFGAAHVVDVLLGNATDKVHQNRHDRLSVFGIGTELSANAWRSVVRQLVVLGYLRADAERYGALTLTEQSRPLLRGEAKLELREDTKVPSTGGKKARAADPAAPADERLFEALRDCRRRIATEQGVPPYVIFHDATLKAMAADRPTSPEALLGLPGVGRTKLERYGDRFLEVLRAHALVSPADDAS